MKYLSFIILLFHFSCSSLQHEENRSLPKYEIVSINKTENHLIYDVLNESGEEGKIVISKKSNQLTNKNIEVGQKYFFQTEELKIALGGHIVYEVDNTEVWDAFEDGFLRIGE